MSSSALKRALEVKDAILKRCPVRALATLDKNLMLGDAKNRELISLFLRADWDPRSTSSSSTGAGTREEAASAADEYLKLFKLALK